MACFLVPVAEAVITTVATKVVKSKEDKAKKDVSDVELNVNTKIPFSRKLKWLSSLLWGGSFLLAFEHLWHGEVIPWFPFLTAASNSDDAMEMLHEMSTAGVTMAVLVTIVWVGMVLVSNSFEKKALKVKTAEK